MLRKILLPLLLIVALTAGMVGGAAAEAMSLNGSGVDVIMILDCSESMNGNDPNHLMTKSAMNFIDMCDVSGTRVALVPFNTDVSYAQNFLDVSQITNRETLRNKLNGTRYASVTDAGDGFTKALEFYRNRGAQNGKAIVLFFSDGKIDTNDATRDGASLNEVNAAVASFAADDVPIFVIGLQGDDPIDQTLLNKIAEDTGTRAARIVRRDDTNALQDTFSEIFAEYLNTVPLAEDYLDSVNADGFITVSINIPNNTILEANVNLSMTNPATSATFRDVTVRDPSGAVIAPTTWGNAQAGSVLTGDAGAYYNVKIVRPVYGTWRISFPSAGVEGIETKMISNYDLDLRMDEPETTVKNARLDLTARFYSNNTGASYNDPYIYQEDMISSSLVTRDDLPVEGERRAVQGGLAAVVRGIDVGPVGQQRLGEFRAAQARRPVQRRHAVPGGGVGRGPPF